MLFSRERPLSPFAVDYRATRGRLLPESPSPTRTQFQRDRDRIIHSTAFRRLKHKTQVFVEHEGDHFRTRLTHTIEVSQIARALARTLGLDEDLAEALALAHDLGHTPFGHAGEDALDALMKGEGGFDHNAQALRIVTNLEKRYAAFDGLNLTWETLEGLVKHNGPLLDAECKPVGRYAKAGISLAILHYDRDHPLDLASYASAEAQVAAIADDIAYNAHDIDDGLRAGLFKPYDLRAVPLIADMLDEIEAAWPRLEEGRVAHEIMRRVITRLVEDAGAESERRLVALSPKSAAEIRAASVPVISFSDAMLAHEKTLKTYLFEHMYRAPRILTQRIAAAKVIEGLFRHYLEHPADMGEADIGNLTQRRVADYIAGMTDRFALHEYQRLFDETPPLR
ncbi:MAG: deoxyguanosinetriphosphate triphosphohydrolase [Rhabdaerophilum sp.]